MTSNAPDRADDTNDTNDTNATAFWSREQILKRRDARRTTIVAYLDPVDRRRAVGLSASAIAERTGLSKQSVAQTLAALVSDGVAIKRHDGKSRRAPESVYFLAARKTVLRVDTSSADAAAIALYRAEKAKHEAKPQRDVMAEARAELARLDSLLSRASGPARKRGAQKAGAASKQRATAS